MKRNVNLQPVALALGASLLAAMPIPAQKTTAGAPVDTSVQSSPLPGKKPTHPAAAVDASAQSSPIPESKSSGVWMAPHTALPIALDEAIDSGKLKNGQTVHARLTTAVAAHGKTLPAGSPVEITVVGTVPAGKLTAEGEFSLQLESIDGIHAYTDTQTFRGKPGARDVADAAPAVGTDAGLARGATLTFHVLSPPVEATAPPPNVPNPPGAINGTAVGDPPPPGSSPRLAAEENRSTSGNGSAQPVQQPNTTSRPINNGQPQPH